MDPFAAALDALFNAPGSISAVYVAAASEPIGIRAIRDQHTDDLSIGSRPTPVATNIIMIRRSEVGGPSAGDSVTLGRFDVVASDDPKFVIAGEPYLDVEGLTWSCELLGAD